MKLEIDKQVLEATKTSLIKTIASLKGLAHEQTSLINKTLINDCIACLKNNYNSLELAKEPKPIRKIGITTK